MIRRVPEPLLLSDIQALDSDRHKWFDEESATALAGRCLVDVLEYVRNTPNVPGRFDQLTKAHALRLACICLSDLDEQQMLQQLKPRILAMVRRLRVSRKSKVPYYGDDFWDWAVVLSGFAVVQRTFPDLAIDDAELARELKSYYDNVVSRLSSGLTIAPGAGEWYGPATAVLAYRIFDQFRSRFPDAEAILKALRGQALEEITGGKYRSRDVIPYHVYWHYGQVVAQLSLGEDTPQARYLADLSVIDNLSEQTEQVYALARVLQGTRDVSGRVTFGNALERLYRCQNLSRPLGQGIVGDNIKGSLNVLEALWPALTSDEKVQTRALVHALIELYARTNAIGIVVAVEREAKAVTQAFHAAGASIEDRGTHTVIGHARYRVVVRQGKHLFGSFEAARRLVDDHKARSVIMCGIAGSLGKSVTTKEKGVQFLGPNLGNVVVAAAMAPFRIRDKARETVVNAGVPFDGSTWMMIPTDTVLFELAHRAADELFGASGNFYEGLIVTGTGIKDAPGIKAEMLAEFPGGLAVEEEGFAVGLLCIARGVPYLNVRGISDLAEGDKQKQQVDPQVEEDKQTEAALAAARLTVRLVELMSESW